MRAGWPCIYRPAVGEGSRDDLGWPISIACACDLCVNQLHAGSELFETGSNMWGWGTHITITFLLGFQNLIIKSAHHVRVLMRCTVDGFLFCICLILRVHLVPRTCCMHECMIRWGMHDCCVDWWVGSWPLVPQEIATWKHDLTWQACGSWEYARWHASASKLFGGGTRRTLAARC